LVGDLDGEKAGSPMQPSISGVPLAERYIFAEAGVGRVRRRSAAQPVDQSAKAEE
jgi:hypothetical protein